MLLSSEVEERPERITKRTIVPLRRLVKKIIVQSKKRKIMNQSSRMMTQRKNNFAID